MVVIYIVSFEEVKSWIYPIKPGFNTCVSRTHNGTRCLTIYEHQCSQALPSLGNKSLRARNKLAHVELLRGDARPVPRYAVTVTYKNPTAQKTKNIFLRFEKKSKAKAKNIMTTFGKSLFLTKKRMRYAIYMPPNTKDLAINQTMGAYGNRQRANNSDLLQSLKHLMETVLYIHCRLVRYILIQVLLLYCIYNQYQLYNVVLLPSSLSIVFAWLLLSMLRLKDVSQKSVSQSLRQSKRVSLKGGVS